MRCDPSEPAVVVRAFGRTAVAFAMLVAGCSCGRGHEPARAASTAVAAAQPAPSAASAMPHGDHNPHPDGVVLMKGNDLHYEVVLDPTGRSHAVYFTDATREDLPASIASAVTLTIKRPGAPDERVAMRIDDAGESWIGSGRAVADPAKAGARVEFTIRGEPYWIDVPFATK